MVDPGADGEIPEAVAGLGPVDLCDARAFVGCCVTRIDEGGVCEADACFRRGCLRGAAVCRVCSPFGRRARDES